MNIKTLFENFKTTREWKKLSPSSQRAYDLQMRKGLTDYFLIRTRVSQINEEFVDELYDKIKTDVSLSMANMFMKVMRRIWSVGRRKKWVSNNPFREMGLEGEEAREIRWTVEQYNLYIRTTIHYGRTALRTLAAFCYVLGQRPGDMLKLTRKNFNSLLTEVTFIQQKTGKKMHMPLTLELIRLAKAAFAYDNDKLIDISAREANEQHRDILRVTGLPTYLQLRDLRRTAISEVMENGGSDAEGQSISGHVNRDELNTYSPSNITMARHALEKRFGKQAFN